MERTTIAGCTTAQISTVGETERAFMLQTLRIFSSISTGFLLLFSDFQKRDNRSVHLSTQGR